MAKSIISSFPAFEQRFKGERFLEEDPARAGALKRYFEIGGVISVGGAAGSWPELVYPSRAKLGQQLNDLLALRQQFVGKQRLWRNKISEANTYYFKHNLLKFSDSIYWEHMAKMLRDKDYKADVEKVGLPVHLVADKRWKPMVRMFLTNLEYRKQLVETVENSVVYKKDRKLARYAQQLVDFKKEIGSKGLTAVEKKLSALDKDIEMVRTMLSWAKT